MSNARLIGNLVTTGISAIGSDTDELNEGTTNLYFTTDRARSSFTAGPGVVISSGEISSGILFPENNDWGNITDFDYTPLGNETGVNATFDCAQSPIDGLSNKDFGTLV
jgi:hypothetical protein